MTYDTATADNSELFPADVQTVIEGKTRKIIKTYILTENQNPNGISREDFERDGWSYALSDITEKQNSKTDRQNHSETMVINTSTKDLNEILKQLSPTIDYQSDDGYCGLLSLNISSIKCEAAGYKNSSYTVTATREYTGLPNNDLSYIPKSITDNGHTLQLDDVKWEIEGYINVDYEDIPDVYRAVAKYTGTAAKSVVTGYITTAEYTGEITKNVIENTVYTVYFTGTEINPQPDAIIPIETMTEPEESSEIMPIEGITNRNFGEPSLILVLIVISVFAAVFVAVMFFLRRRNVKIYRDKFSILVAKDKLEVKSPVIDLSPLEGQCFGVEIEKFTAKLLNGKTVEIKQNSVNLTHKIAYEGNIYKIEIDFGAKTIQAIY